MRRKRRNHWAAFKAKVALAATCEDKTLTELAEHYDARPNQIEEWRRKLVDNAQRLFERGTGRENNTERKLKERHAKIGQRMMERIFCTIKSAIEVQRTQGRGRRGRS